MRAGSPGELLGWDEVDVTRVRELTAVLSDILSEESAPTSVATR